MIDFELDEFHGIVTVWPTRPLSADDFGDLAMAVDAQIEAGSDLTGVIVDAARFPGWDRFGAMVTHLRFVRDHHRHVKKIAVVTDSHLGDLAEHLVAHFISAEVRHFPAGQGEQARDWILGPSPRPGDDHRHAGTSRDR